MTTTHEMEALLPSPFLNAYMENIENTYYNNNMIFV